MTIPLNLDEIRDDLAELEADDSDDAHRLVVAQHVRPLLAEVERLTKARDALGYQAIEALHERDALRARLDATDKVVEALRALTSSVSDPCKPRGRDYGCLDCEPTPKNIFDDWRCAYHAAVKALAALPPVKP